MSKPQFITTPLGEELVVLSKAEYEALISAAELVDEDDADVAIYDQRVAALAAGRDEVLPVEVANGLLRGESRLKAIRKWRGLTQADLAERVGVGQGYLSELEGGRKRGAPDTLAALAQALNVPASWLA